MALKYVREKFFAELRNHINGKTQFTVLQSAWNGIHLIGYDYDNNMKEIIHHDFWIPSYCLKLIESNPQTIYAGGYAINYRHPGFIKVGCNVLRLQDAEKIIRFGRKQQRLYQQLTPPHETKNVKRIPAKRKKDRKKPLPFWAKI